MSCSRILPIVVFILLTVCTFMAHAGVYDTIISGNGTAGPYVLSDRFVDAGSIVVKSALDDSAYIAEHVFIASVNAILFAQPLDTAARIAVRYRSKYQGLLHTFSLNRPAWYDSAQHVYNMQNNMPAQFMPASEDQIVATGYKTIGVSVGNAGQFDLEQSLAVTLSGKLADSTFLTGTIADQGSSLEGSTREVSELDMVYIGIKNPRYSAIIGDQYVQWPGTWQPASTKKIKGISLSYTPVGAQVKAFGAISGGKYALQQVTVVRALQGPYALTGGGENAIIIPVTGTLLVRVNGIPMAEGIDADYTVDYSMGSVTFTPRHALREGDALRIEYEYKLFDYQRVIAGTQGEIVLKDSSVRVNGALWMESDNKEYPLDLQLSRDDISALTAAGDSAPRRAAQRLVLAQNVPAEDAKYPLYTIVGSRDSLGDSVAVFVHTRYNPLQPERIQGFYHVWFRFAGQGRGDYSFDTVDQRGQIFSYAGKNRGSYTPLAPLPMPRRSIIGELRGVATPFSWLRLDVAVAGQDHDANLFSQGEDLDNQSGAGMVGFLLGKRSFAHTSHWSQGVYRRALAGFTGPVVSSYELADKWDLPSVGSVNTAVRQVVDVSMGTHVLNTGSAEIGYSMYAVDQGASAHRVSAGLGTSTNNTIAGRVNSTLIRPIVGLDTTLTRRDTAAVVYSQTALRCQLSVSDIWRARVGDTLQRGVLASELLWESVRLETQNSQSGSVGAVVSRVGVNEAVAVDTGYSIFLRQRIAQAIAQGWTVTANGSYSLNNIYRKATAYSLLLMLGQSLDFDQVGFTSTQRYSANLQEAAVFVQVPRYVGKGLGTVSYNDSLREYLPDRSGDFIIDQQRVSSAGFGAAQFSAPLRTTMLDGEWRLAPINWRVGDAEAWTDGTFALEEHVSFDDDLTRWSWVPGYSSLSGKLADNSISYSRCQYRQTVGLRANAAKQYAASVYVQPGYTLVRSYKETQWEAGMRYETRYTDWRLGATARVLWIDHLPATVLYTPSYQVNDRMAQAVVTYLDLGEFEPYVECVTGWASQADQRGWYGRVKPGCTWRIGEKGWVELSYTASNVGFDREMDFRIAQGFAPGISHVIDAFANIQTGSHFTVTGSYSGTFAPQRPDPVYKGGLHVLSVRMTAYF